MSILLYLMLLLSSLSPANAPEQSGDQATGGSSESSQQARDSERKIDINSVAMQFEIYYSDNGYYPSVSNVTNGSGQWLTSTFKDIDTNTLVAPGAAANTKSSFIPSSDALQPNQYGYRITSGASANCNPSNCQKFELSWRSEATGQLIFKRSLN